MTHGTFFYYFQHPSLFIWVTQEKLWFISPGNFFHNPSEPKYSIYNPLETMVVFIVSKTRWSCQLPNPVCVEAQKPGHSFSGLFGAIIELDVQITNCGLSAQCVSLLWRLSLMSRFWPRSRRYLRVLWEVDQSRRRRAGSGKSGGVAVLYALTLASITPCSEAHESHIVHSLTHNPESCRFLKPLKSSLSLTHLHWLRWI